MVMQKVNGHNKYWSSQINQAISLVIKSFTTKITDLHLLFLLIKLDLHKQIFKKYHQQFFKRLNFTNLHSKILQQILFTLDLFRQMIHHFEEIVRSLSSLNTFITRTNNHQHIQDICSKESYFILMLYRVSNRIIFDLQTGSSVNKIKQMFFQKLCYFQQQVAQLPLSIKLSSQNFFFNIFLQMFFSIKLPLRLSQNIFNILGSGLFNIICHSTLSFQIRIYQFYRLLLMHVQHHLLPAFFNFIQYFALTKTILIKLSLENDFRIKKFTVRQFLKVIIIIEVMEEELKESHWSAQRRYTKISIKRRQRLVNMVLVQGMAITKVSKLTRINISTAKLIVKKYQLTGQFFDKKMKKQSKVPKNQANGKNEKNVKVQQELQEDPEPTVKIEERPKNAIQEPQVEEQLVKMEEGAENPFPQSNGPYIYPYQYNNGVFY